MEKSITRVAPNKIRAFIKKRCLNAVSLVGAMLLWLCVARVIQAQALDSHDVRFDHVCAMGALGSRVFLQDYMMTVIPTFWQRGWFYTLAILIAVLGIAGIFLGRLRTAEMRRRQLEVLVTARTQTLKEINFQLQREIIERQNAEEEAQRYAQTLAYLHQIVRQLTETLDQQQIAAQLAQNGLNVLGTETLSVWLREELSGEERLMCWSAAERDHTLPHNSPLHTCLRDAPNIAWDVIRKEQSVVINDVPNDPYYHIRSEEQNAAPLRSLLIVPLRVQDTTLGVLWMANKRAGNFTKTDLTLAETLAAAAAIAIDNARLVTELRDYAVDLESHIAELDAFARSVAHDLKNPLAILILRSTVLEEEWEHIDPEEVYTGLQQITLTGYKLTNIIDALLLLTLLRRTEQIEILKLDMQTIVAEAKDRLRHEINQIGVCIHQPAVWPEVWGHATLIENIWFNYLSNALKYGGQPADGIPPSIQLGFDPPAEDDDLVRFWVRDNGIGMKPEAQSRLFTEFTRLEPKRGHGHGLGLSIVRRIAEKLGGEIGVESAPGEGSTFWFTLPRRAMPGRQSIKPPNPTPPAPD